MKNNFDKILNELSYRVSTGIPDLRNEQHLIKLWDILKEHNWSIDARVELLKRLDEQGKERLCPICEAQCQQGFNPGRDNCVAASGAKGTGKSAQGGEEEPKEEPTDDFERPELSKEERVEARRTQSKECNMWLNFDKKEGANQFKDDTESMSEEEKGAAGSAQSKCGEAVTVQGATRVKELMSEGKSFEESIQIIEKEMMSMIKKDGLLTKAWVKAGLSIVKKLHEEIGIDNIEEIGWDTGEGRSLVGTDDKHGTSSDMFIKTKDGKVIGESLKKDFKVFLLNGGYALKIKELEDKLGTKLPDNIQAAEYKRRRDEESKKIKKRVNEELNVSGVVSSISDDPNIFISKMCSSNGDAIRKRLTSMFGDDVKDINFGDFDEVRNFLKNLSPEQKKQAENFIKNLDGSKRTGDLSWVGVLGRHPLAKEMDPPLTNDIRTLSNELVNNLYDHVKPGSEGNKQFKEMVAKDMHFKDLLFGTPPRLDEFNISHGEDPAVRIKKEQVQKLFGISDEEIEAAKNDPEKQKAIMAKIQDNLVITKQRGVPIISVKTEDGDIPLYEMGTRARGLNASPTLEISQHALGTFTLKNGTADYKKWPEEDRRGYGKTEVRALNNMFKDEDFDYESNKEEIDQRIKTLEKVDPNNPSLKKVKQAIAGLDKK